MKTFGWIMLIFIGTLIISTLLNTCNLTTSMIDNGTKTVYQEFKPEELLRKYEWFKDASAECEQKLATLKTYETRFNHVKESYGADSLKRKNWQRADIEQWNIWESEYLGVKSSYNELASQYNAAMSKFNYRFCNTGDLPAGADVALPREFKPYITN